MTSKVWVSSSTGDSRRGDHEIELVWVGGMMWGARFRDGKVSFGWIRVVFTEVRVTDMVVSQSKKLK